MRLAGQIKMGYYPTPAGVVERLRNHLSLPSYAFHALDPCCGEGLALESLLGGSRAVTHGIELDGERAREAGRRLGHVVHAGYEEVDIALESMSLLYLNPPYDDGEGERKELTFLRDLTPSLTPGGTLVYIIPRSRLTAPVAELLVSNFTRIQVYKFPEDDYAAFRQIVVLGRRTSYPMRARAEDLLDRVESPRLPDLPTQVYDPYDLPPTGNAEIRLRRHSPDELVAMAERSPLWARVCDLVEPPAASTVGRPPAPLHVGHLGLLLSAGCLNGQVGEGPDRHLVVGKPVKHIVTSTEIEDDGKGEEVEVTRKLQTFRVTIKMLLPTGELRQLV